MSDNDVNIIQQNVKELQYQNAIVSPSIEIIPLGSE